MIIAIIGPTCVGKTTIGRAQANELGLSFRSCGDVVSERAQALGVRISNFPDSEHLDVDKETLNWCKSIKRGVLDGRYLDVVLAPIASNVAIVRLVADPSTRASRKARRDGQPSSESDIASSDAADDAFRSRLYPTVNALNASFDLDTSNKTPQECVELLASKFR